MATWLWRIILAALCLAALLPALHIAVSGGPLIPLIVTALFTFLILMFELPSIGAVGALQFFAGRWIFLLLFFACAGFFIYAGISEFSSPVVLSERSVLQRVVEWLRLVPGGHLIVTSIFLALGIAILQVVLRSLKGASSNRAVHTDTRRSDTRG
jgi:hypothetical protein